FAQTEEFEKNIRIIQQKSFIKKGRFEALPSFGISLNETLTSHFNTGIAVNYYFTDQISFGLSYQKYFGEMSDLATEVGDDFQIYPEKRLINQYIGGHAAYTPIYGKLLVVDNFIVYYDLYVTAGAGATKTAKRTQHFTGNIGIGMKFFVFKFLALNVEFNDYIYNENFQSGDEIMNNFTLSFGLGVFVPPGFDYKYQK
ncbi:MAG: outer membrane beta-barrel domain-containing protein, partial [Deltaproteobacteria bacterium]|nr:outer membrane beta-barrel domain-containing protein [Deltaproteobacteria bacterium]